MNIPANLKRQVKAASREPDRSPYYDSLADVPHNRHFKDGEYIYIANGDNWDVYVFRRTNDRDPDGGNLLPLSVTTGAAATW